MTRLEYITEQGYKPGCPPAGISGHDGHDIDAPICAEATCEQCGHKGMDYKPIWKTHKNRKTMFAPRRALFWYRAFAVCPECGYEEEF